MFEREANILNQPSVDDFNSTVLMAYLILSGRLLIYLQMTMSFKTTIYLIGSDKVIVTLHCCVTTYIKWLYMATPGERNGNIFISYRVLHKNIP